MKLFHVIPWNSNKNIGISYNTSMKIVGSNDWICFLDGDAIHTTTYFGSRIESIIQNNPEFTLFTCYTNRVGTPYQIAPGVDKNTNDLNYHRNFGESLWQNFTTSVLDITNNSPLSGVVILIKKTTWERVGGFNETGMLGVDNDIHTKCRTAGFKVGLMQGIYVQHWYRGGNQKDISHLK